MNYLGIVHELAFVTIRQYDYYNEQDLHCFVYVLHYHNNKVSITINDRNHSIV